jgi:hypothetical protein
MKKALLILVFLCGCNKAKEAVGLGPTPEEIAAQKELEQKKLKDGDVMVSRWADNVESTASNSGFKHNEGLTETDPWGQQIKIEYKQDWTKEVATVRSAGPDGVFHTSDDLVRVRISNNPLGLIDGIPPGGWLAIIWISCGIITLVFASGLSRRRSAKGKPAKHGQPIAFAAITILLAPLVAMIYGIQFVGGALGADGDFFDGFDFDFNIDIDL